MTSNTSKITRKTSNEMSAIDSSAEMTASLAQWEREYGTGINPKTVLTRMAEIVEAETEAWYKQDPDPFDDRHPGRADPNCSLGHVLKVVFKNENFLNRLVTSYLLSRDQSDIHPLCCRLLLDVMPGLETSVVFQENEMLVQRLIQWAEAGAEPLSSYAIGILASAMEVQDIATNFKDNNATLVPLLIERLHKLKKHDVEETMARSGVPQRPFADIGKYPVSTLPSPSTSRKGGVCNNHKPQTIESNIGDDTIDGVSEFLQPDDSTKKLFPIRGGAVEAAKVQTNPQPTDSSQQQVACSPPAGDTDQQPSVTKCSQESTDSKFKTSPEINVKEVSSAKPVFTGNECSNSSWIDLEHFVIGSHSVHPLTTKVQQRLIVQYLTPMGEYQELLSHVFEHKVMDLIFYYIDLAQNRDVRLAFDSLKYLASLLCHKKFAVEFIQRNGIERLLAVHRPSVAATGVSICLYYLAYFEDAMERVCLLPHSVLSEMVSYMLWLLECSHESGRCHATMFFSLSFPFRIILELFDLQDGLRKLYNVISTLSILSMEDTNDNRSEDEVFTSRQGARHVTVAFKKYFEAHLAIKADQVRRSHLRNEGGSPLGEIPAYKASKFPAEVIQDNIELLLECLPYRMRWEPVSHFLKLGGVSLLLQLVALGAEWSNYSGKSETIRSALDTIAICAVTPRTQIQLCEAIQMPENTATPAVSILLGLAEGEIMLDPDVMRAALSVINNCVCGPTSRLGGHVGRIKGGSTRKRQTVKNGEDLLHKMWNCMRSNNGIMVLLKLLLIKTPITEADGIRALACKAFDGLARSETVKQIIGKLPLFNNGQLQLLMREPVLQEKRQEHVQFCKYATELIERVSGKPKHTNIDASMDRIRRADIVTQTKIVYQEKELLQLIHDHLLDKGLADAAGVLQREAELVRVSTPPLALPASPHIYSTPSNGKSQLRQLSSPVPSNCATPQSARTVDLSKHHTLATVGPSSHIKVNIVSSKVQSNAFSNQTRMLQTKNIIRRKQESCASPAVVKRQQNYKQEHSISLDKIVTEYLRKQHAVCKNPVVTCPPFSLHTTHRCPDPKHRNSAPTNITSRISRKMISPRFGGPDGLKCDRKYIYSRFRPIRSYRDGEDDGCFSCSAFSPCEKYLMLGTYAGDLKMYNVQSGEESATYACHSSPLTHCEPTRDGMLVLTSSTWGTPLSALWSMGDIFDMKHSFEEDSYVEFSRHTQDRIIGTKEDTAHIYDITTGRSLLKLHDSDMANNYTRNRATFNPTDDLVLNDGVLWDVNSGKAIHKFDKFNPNISGVFHPMGLEVIVNSEVWDLRTFHLLHTVPGLDQCQIRFNNAGDIIYGAIHQFDDEESMEEQTIKSPFGSSFRTFDATDYSNIATIDVKKNIFDLCTDSSDCFLAVIENQKSPETLSEESLCRLYEVGRLRDEEDDQEEDDEDAMEDEDDAGDDDDDDDDDGDDDDENDDGSNIDSSSDGSDSVENDDDDDDDDDDDGIDDDADEDDDDDDDDDMDDILFELSDYSNL